MDQISRLEVTNREGWQKEYLLQKGIIYIGAGPSNDIDLDIAQGGGVAPLHAQLIASGSNGSAYRLINLNNADIVVMDPAGEQGLPPQAVLNLVDGQEFWLGEYQLIFRGGSSGYGGVVDGQGRGGQAIGARLSMPYTRLAPNQYLEGQVIVSNLGQKTGVTFDLDLEGMDDECYDIAPGPLLSSGAEKEVLFRLRHRGHKPLAGNWRIVIRVTAPGAYPGEEATVSQTIEVLPHYRHRSQIMATDGVKPAVPPQDDARPAPKDQDDPPAWATPSSAASDSLDDPDSVWGTVDEVAPPAPSEVQPATKLKARPAAQTQTEDEDSSQIEPGPSPAAEALWSAQEASPPPPVSTAPSQEAQDLWGAPSEAESVVEDDMPQQADDAPVQVERGLPPVEDVARSEPAEPPPPEPVGSTTEHEVTPPAQLEMDPQPAEVEAVQPVTVAPPPPVIPDEAPTLTEPEVVAETAAPEAVTLSPQPETEATVAPAPPVEAITSPAPDPLPQIGSEDQSSEPAQPMEEDRVVSEEKTWWQRVLARTPFYQPEPEAGPGLVEKPKGQEPEDTFGRGRAPTPEEGPAQTAPQSAEAESGLMLEMEAGPAIEETTAGQSEMVEAEAASDQEVQLHEQGEGDEALTGATEPETGSQSGDDAPSQADEPATLSIKPDEVGTMPTQKDEDLSQTDAEPMIEMRSSSTPPTEAEASEAVQEDQPEFDRAAETVSQPQEQEVGRPAAFGVEVDDSDWWGTEVEGEESPQEKPRVIKLKSSSASAPAPVPKINEGRDLETLEEDWWTVEETVEEVDKSSSES